MRRATTAMNTAETIINQGTAITGEKGVRSVYCEAPSGPFRQNAPDPFFSSGGSLRSTPATQSRQRLGTPRGQHVRRNWQANAFVRYVVPDLPTVARAPSKKRGFT